MSLLMLTQQDGAQCRIPIDQVTGFVQIEKHIPEYSLGARTYVATGTQKHDEEANGWFVRESLDEVEKQWRWISYSDFTVTEGEVKGVGLTECMTLDGQVTYVAEHPDNLKRDDESASDYFKRMYDQPCRREDDE